MAVGRIARVTGRTLPRGANALDEPERCDPRLLGMASMLDDLSLLTSLHRQVVVESGRADLLDITDKLEARRADDPDAPTELVAALDPDTTERIARLLTVHLHLTNLAEERQRARSLRREDGELGVAPTQATSARPSRPVDPTHGPGSSGCGSTRCSRLTPPRPAGVRWPRPCDGSPPASTPTTTPSRAPRSAPRPAAGCSRTSTSCSAPRPCGSPGPPRPTR